MAALSLAGAWLGTRDPVMNMITAKPFRPSSASDLASLDGATAWLNSPPLTAADLQGKVVLVDFWTYTCINWLRTLPYVRAWAARYKEHGLVVIGVHTPEFASVCRRRLSEFSCVSIPRNNIPLKNASVGL